VDQQDFVENTRERVEVNRAINQRLSIMRSGLSSVLIIAARTIPWHAIEEKQTVGEIGTHILLNPAEGCWHVAAIKAIKDLLQQFNVELLSTSLSLTAWSSKTQSKATIHTLKLILPLPNTSPSYKSPDIRRSP
jgi:hypothetical protein